MEIGIDLNRDIQIVTSQKLWSGRAILAIFLTLFGEKEGVSCSWTLSKLQTEMMIFIYLVPKEEYVPK